MRYRPSEPAYHQVESGAASATAAAVDENDRQPEEQHLASSLDGQHNAHYVPDSPSPRPSVSPKEENGGNDFELISDGSGKNPRPKLRAAVAS